MNTTQQRNYDCEFYGISLNQNGTIEIHFPLSDIAALILKTFPSDSDAPVFFAARNYLDSYCYYMSELSEYYSVFPYSEFSHPEQYEKLDIISDQFRQILTQWAVTHYASSTV